MLFLTKPWKLVYDDSGNEGKGGENSGEGEGKEKPTLKTLIEKHGLQEELNAMMANNRKTLTQKNQELIEQLTNLRDQAQMSTQAKEELEARIEELQTQFMSKEEITKRESEKMAKAHAKELEKLTSENKKWQSLYATSTIQRALLDAAVEGEAIQPSQIVAMLGQSTQLVEEVNETGQGKGEYKVVVKFNDIDTDGNKVILNLSPKDAIKRMRELPDLYGNLFKGDATGGLGATGTSGKGERQPKLSEIVKDPAKYQEWRKKNPDLDVSKLRR